VSASATGARSGRGDLYQQESMRRPLGTMDGVGASRSLAIRPGVSDTLTAPSFGNVLTKDKWVRIQHSSAMARRMLNRPDVWTGQPWSGTAISRGDA
jgi:hypothetical protein